MRQLRDRVELESVLIGGAFPDKNAGAAASITSRPLATHCAGGFTTFDDRLAF
jgi:hypothetical protein